MEAILLLTCFCALGCLVASTVLASVGRETVFWFSCKFLKIHLSVCGWQESTQTVTLAHFSELGGGFHVPVKEVHFGFIRPQNILPVVIVKHPDALLKMQQCLPLWCPPMTSGLVYVFPIVDFQQKCEPVPEV